MCLLFYVCLCPTHCVCCCFLLLLVLFSAFTLHNPSHRQIQETKSRWCVYGVSQVDGVYVANVADQAAEPELKLLGGLQAVLFNIHVMLSVLPPTSPLRSVCVCVFCLCVHHRHVLAGSRWYGLRCT